MSAAKEMTIAEQVKKIMSEIIKIVETKTDK